MTNNIEIWINKPRKYLESNCLISSTDLSALFFIFEGNNNIIHFSILILSLKRKKVINNTDKTPIVKEPKILPIEFKILGIVSMLDLDKLLKSIIVLSKSISKFER